MGRLKSADTSLTVLRWPLDNGSPFKCQIITISQPMPSVWVCFFSGRYIYMAETSGYIFSSVLLLVASFILQKIYRNSID